ncbi:MAG: class I SAM-dependent methyltransferase [Blautia sp.]|nr:class I SAM-dependent methyltransferase [Blautia sp.]MCM1200949.1 class I SAM-dependent methyltransferase [Bacteroides fragilis]
MAIFNLDYYSGENLYSDGDIENTIMNIVKNGENYAKYAGSENYYPIMYHLSSERENILNWYPFKQTDKILEVGSGCGALTELFCQRAKSVTSIELSKRRAEINYERHKSYDNLEIIVGNFNEIELTQKYDYVILTGVFEYAISFTDSDDPYVSFLNNLKKYLTDNGRILISIENRLGIKYFTGAMEDHVNEYYLGLNNYPNNNTVRTFTKTELEEIFKRCSINVWKFYYPYPDYKFPTEIFSDSNINSGNYGKVYRNYQKERVELINEIEMIQTFKKEEIMDVFSNSFLVELATGNLNLTDIVYVKANNTRRKEFCISTKILLEEGEYKVEKAALSENALSHINQIYKNQEMSLPSGFTYLKGELYNGVVKYPYLQTENMDVFLAKMMTSGKKETIKKKIDMICASILDSSSDEEKIYTAEFKKWFGDAQYAGKLECIKNCNIDLIFDNIYPGKEDYVIIDPEWVCPFWVPARFIIWRMLNEWYAKNEKAEKYFPRKELYMEYGITEEMTAVFRSWAIYFATRYVSCDDLDNATIPVMKVDLNQILKDFQDINSLCSALYIDYGNGFSEADKMCIKIKLQNGEFNIKVVLDSSKRIEALRWDPVEYRYCRCFIRSCTLDEKEKEVIAVNAEEKDATLFMQMDPQFIIQIPPGNYSELAICGTFEYLDNRTVYENVQKIREREIEHHENIRKIMEQEIEELKKYNIIWKISRGWQKLKGVCLRKR